MKKFENLSVKLAKIGHKNISSVKVGVHPLRLLVFKARNVEQLGVCTWSYGANLSEIVQSSFNWFDAFLFFVDVSNAVKLFMPLTTGQPLKRKKSWRETQIE